MAPRLCLLFVIQAALLASCGAEASVDEKAQPAALQDPKGLVGALADTDPDAAKETALGEAASAHKAREVKSLPTKENARGPKPQNRVPSGTTQELLGAFKSMQAEMAGIKAQQKKEKEERKAEQDKSQARQRETEAKLKTVNAQLAAERESRKKEQSHGLMKAKQFEAELKAVTMQLSDAKAATRVETETRALKEAGDVRPHTVRTARVCAKTQAMFGYCTPTTAVPQADGKTSPQRGSEVVARQQKGSGEGIGEGAKAVAPKKKKASPGKKPAAATNTGCHLDLRRKGYKGASFCRKWMCDAKQAAKEGDKLVDRDKQPCAKKHYWRCLPGLRFHHGAMKKCRILCNTECDPSQPHYSYSKPTFLPAGQLAPGHRHCKDKFTMSTTAGDRTNRASGEATPVPVCGKCVSRDFVLRPSHHVGMKVLGVCTKLKEHPLMLEAEQKCKNARKKPCAGVVFRKCQKFMAKYGSFEHTDPKKSVKGITYTMNPRKGVPKSGAAFAFTCGQVQAVDSSASTATLLTSHECTGQLTRIVERTVVSCYSASEAKSRQECVNFKQTLSCHTHKLDLGKHRSYQACQRAYSKDAVAKAFDVLTKKGVGSSWKKCTEIGVATTSATARL